MDRGITVDRLYAACKEQIARGNGNKYIIISDDDEGNGFHTLNYLFVDGDIQDLIDLEHDTGMHSAYNTVVLG